jgi:predicted nicotinamide N-methyase
MPNAATLATPDGEVPLADYRLRLGGREWGLLHTAAVFSQLDEQRYLGEQRERLPYGVVLWPAAVALAHEVAARAGEFGGRRVLELGAGTGLPGIVAASLGARVVQTDRHELALAVCRRNGARNGVGPDAPARRRRHAAPRPAPSSTAGRLGAWDDAARYDWILGADVIYGEAAHPHLRRIFDANLAPGGRLLLADPFRSMSLRLLEALEADGWRVAMSKWTVGEDRRGARAPPRGRLRARPARLTLAAVRGARAAYPARRRRRGRARRGRSRPPPRR